MTSAWPLRLLRLPLRWLLLALTLGVLAPMLAFAILLGLRLSAKEQVEIRARLSDRAEDLAGTVDRQALAAVAALTAMAQSDVLRRDDLRQFHAEAARVADSQGWSSVILVGRDGQQRVNTAFPPGASLPAARDPDSLARAFETGRPVLGSLALGRNRWAVPVRVPVSRDGAIVYVITAVMPATTFAGAVGREGAPDGTVATILDTHATIVARTGATDGVVGQRAPASLSPVVERALAAAYRDADAEAGPLYVAAARAPFSGWTAVVTAPAAAVEASWRESMAWIASIGGVMLALSVAGAFAVARWVAAPLAGATSAAEALARSESSPVPRSSVGEVARLAVALRESGARLEETARQRERLDRERSDLLHGAESARAVAERAEARLAVVGDIARSITASLDLDSVLPAIVEGAQRLCGSDTAAIFLRDGDTDAMLPRYRTGAASPSDGALRIEPGQGIGGRVLQTGHTARTDTGDVALMVVPITLAGRVEGLLYLSNAAARPFTDEDERVSLRLADQAAIAIQNARLFGQERAARDEAEAAHRRSALLARASGVLGVSLEGEVLLREVARVLVPDLADGCAVDLVTADGGVHRVAIVHRDPDKAAAGEQLAARYPPGPGHPVFEVIRRGEPFVVLDARQPVLALAQDPEHRELLLRSDIASVVVVPLVARQAVVGAFTFIAGAGRERFDATDVAFARELGQRVGYALENARLYRESEEANRAKDEFLAMLGHELRNPLGAIRTAVALLERDGTSPETVQRARDVVRRQIAHLGDLVDDLLDVARVTTGKIGLSRAPLDLADAARRCLTTLGTRNRDVQIDAPAPVWVHGDLTRVEQIITNLVENALKYTAPGGHVRVAVHADARDGVLSVEDDGIGISEDLLPRIFDLFAQGEQRPHRPQGGLGIGLTLVRRLTELHDGRVDVQSPGPGRGSTFTVRLPKSAPPALTAVTAPPAAAAAGAAPRRILLVEDNEDARAMLRTALVLAGHEVEEAEDGPGGLASAEAGTFDVVLMDVGLPGFDGYEVARRLRATARGARLRLVALTGYGAPEDRQRAQDAGFDVYLVKPVDPARLAAAISA